MTRTVTDEELNALITLANAYVHLDEWFMTSVTDEAARVTSAIRGDGPVKPKQGTGAGQVQPIHAGYGGANGDGE